MQNREDGFKDYMECVWLNSESALSSSNWTSRPKANSRVLTRQIKASFSTEPFIYDRNLLLYV